MKKRSFFSQKIYTVVIAGFLFFGAIFIAQPADAAGLVPCGTGNNPPCTLCHLVIGVKGIIDWGMSVMTFFAIAIIVAMGIVYIVSAGNSGMMTTAKNGIKATLIGFAVMLGAWVIVNIFMITLAKPDLGIKATNWYTFTCDTKSKTNQIGETPGTGPGGNLTCTNGACAKDTAIKSAVNAQTYLPANDYMAILQAGEHYGQTSVCAKGTSGAGACGYSQVIPATAQGVCGISCATIIADVNKDIACGAKVAADFKKYHNTPCVTDHAKIIDCTIDGIKSLSACYNRGFKCSIAPRNVGGKWYDCGEVQGGKPYCDRVSEYASSCNK